MSGAAQRSGEWPVGPGPHGHSTETVAQVMWTVVLALLPTCVAGVVVFGPYAGLLILISAASAAAAEALVQKIRSRPVTLVDGSAVVTGLLLGCCLPPGCRWYVPVTGSFAAIVIGKQLFGGLGRNPFNPALVGRVLLQFLFPAQLAMPLWPMVTRTSVLDSAAGGVFKVASGTPFGADAESFATPLAAVAPGAQDPAVPASPLEAVGRSLGVAPGEVLRDLFLGNIPGCIGEVSKLAILLGGLILLINRYASWRLPAACIAAALVGAIFLPVRDAAGGWTGLYSGDADLRIIAETLLVHLLSGGLLLAAVFMIADPVTRPATAWGQVFYGLAAGLLVAVFRLYGGRPEGACYAILLVNAARLAAERAIAWRASRRMARA
jgi:electron transport complex protein RnfD